MYLQILLDGPGILKYSDFGLSKVEGENLDDLFQKFSDAGETWTTDSNLDDTKRSRVSGEFFPVEPGRVAQSVGHLTRKSGVLGSIPGLATYFRFSFRFFKKGSCQLLAKVCARSTGSPLRRSKPAREKCG